MKKLFTTLFLMLSTIVFSSKIDLFEYNVSLNEDKSIHIKERIVFNTQGELKHGIVQDIITKSANSKLFKFEDRTAIKNFTSNYSFERRRKSNYESYKIGDKNNYLNEITEFLIEYDIYNVVRTDDKNTQIYLNAIGQYWDMPIEKAVVILNFDTTAFNKLEVYTGAKGERGSNFKITGNVISTTQTLEENEGLTFLLNLDKNRYPFTTKDKVYNILKTYPSIPFYLILIILVTIILIYTIIVKFKNKDTKAVIPEFKIDPKISPALCYEVYKRDIKKTLFSEYNVLTVIFLSLITKGIIIKEDKKYILTEKTDLDKLSPEEKRAYMVLKSSKDDLLFDEDKVYEASNTASAYLKSIYKSNIANDAVYNKIIAVVAIFLAFYISTPFIISLFSILLIVALVLFFISVKKYKENGKDIIRNIKGFILYFNTAEKNIFKTFKTQKEILDYSRDMLPYAVAVGVEKQFINQLDKELTVRNYDKAFVYSYIYYDFYAQRYFLERNIRSNLESYNDKHYSSNSHSSGGGFSSGGGYSGGGFSGGGGSSW